MTASPPTPHPSSPPGCTPAPLEAAPSDFQDNALDSRSLLAGRRAVAIEHEGSRYVLRATRSGKLILTK